MGVATMTKALKVLVVDDDPDIVAQLRAFMKEPNFKVRSATNSPEAISQYEGIQPDIVFLDINLPGASGFVTLRKLRELDAYRLLKIVMLTSHTTREDVNTAKMYGADDYMAKPITKQALAHRLMRHFPDRFGKS